MDFPRLRTPRLLLRHLRMEDADEIFAYACDPAMTPFVLWEPHRTVDDTRAWLANVLHEYEEGRPPTWGIQHLGAGVIIGTLGMQDVSALHARAEIGYALARAYWGQGLMVEAVRAVVAYGFDTLGLNRIEARCDVENAASWRVMEKVGMKFEGVLRQNIVLHGRARDARMYGILRQDWGRSAGDSQ